MRPANIATMVFRRCQQHLPFVSLSWLRWKREQLPCTANVHGVIALGQVLQTGGEVRYCCPSQQHICKQQPDIGDDCGQSVLRSVPERFSAFYQSSFTPTDDMSRQPSDYVSRWIPLPLAHSKETPLLLRKRERQRCYAYTPRSLWAQTSVAHLAKALHEASHQADTCPFGSRLIRLRTGDPFGCNHDKHCPNRAKCHKSSNFQSGICCKAVYKDIRHSHDTTEDFVETSDCPPTHEPEKNSAGVQCSPLNPQSCASTNSFCTFSEKQKRFVCCQERMTRLDSFVCFTSCESSDR
ncbi:hypothetical protein COOONC_17048 [Cooperia oncophora]